jgi:UDP-2,3-diacylglucosamine hydrolase
MPHYFFSDVHLGYGDAAADREREARLLRFLSHIAPTAETLVIVGDLFDYWFDYKSVIPRGHVRTLAALSGFVDRGCRVHYLMGNHDFGHGDFFSSELGVSIYPEDIELTLDGRKLYISHGDGKAFRDRGYRILKRVLRNRASQWLYRFLHPTIGIGLAAWSSRNSRAYTDRKDYGQEDGLGMFARGKLREGYDYVLMGHRHSPQVLIEGMGEYINLGDWLSHNTYAVLENGSLRLMEFKG